MQDDIGEIYSRCNDYFSTFPYNFAKYLLSKAQAAIQEFVMGFSLGWWWCAFAC